MDTPNGHIQRKEENRFLVGVDFFSKMCILPCFCVKTLEKTDDKGESEPSAPLVFRKKGVQWFGMGVSPQKSIDILPLI